MHRLLSRVLPALVAVLLPIQLHAQTPAQQPELRFNGIRLTLGGRMQTQFNTTTVDGLPRSELFVRRARIEVGVQVTDRISGVIHPDFAGNEVELKDAYLNFAFSPAVEVLVGNAYRPFGLLEQTTSKRILPIERGVRIRGVPGRDEYGFLSGLQYSNRDLGIQIHGSPEGAPLGFDYEVGILRGPLHGSVGENDSYQFAGRVTAAPAEAVRVGAGWSNRHFAMPGAGTIELRRGNAFEVDLEYGSFAPGLHVLAELSRGDIDPFTDADFWGAQAWLAFRTEPLGEIGVALEPILRASHADADAPGVPFPLGGTLITPGLNIYLDPLNRVMFNYDIWRGAGDAPNAGSFKAMFQFAF